MRLLASTLLLLLPLAAGDLSGRRAPSWALPDSRMYYHDVLDYRGKPLILEFMRTDCPHCQPVAATLEKLKARYGNKIAILHIVSPPDNTSTVASFVARTRDTSPFLFDSGQVAASYVNAKPGAMATSFDAPLLFFIDAQGQIRDDYQGEKAEALTVAQMSAVVDKLVAPATKK